MSKDNQGEPDTPLQPVKDEVISEEKIMMIIETGYNSYFKTVRIIELFKDWHNKLSSPPEPSSKEQEGDAVSEDELQKTLWDAGVNAGVMLRVKEALINNYQLYKKKS